MTFDLVKVIESKREHRRMLAAMPLAEKLRLLDVLREREVSLRSAAPHIEDSLITPSGTSTSRQSTPP